MKLIVRDDVPMAEQRGRPTGAEPVVRRVGELRLHDLAMLRAVVQGVKPAAAAARYLPEMSADERLAVGHLRRVAKAVQSQLEGHGKADLATALMQTAGEGGLVPAATAPSRPSLEEFAATLEADMYSERELVELYEERYGDAPAVVAEDGPGVSRAALVQRALSGIALVQSQDVQAPAGEDGIELWLSERLCRQLRPLGVLRLHELVHVINRQGRNWYRQIEGLGRVRARRLVQWLCEHEEYTGAIVSERVKGVDQQLPAVRQAAADVGVLEVAGSLRREGANALGADSDRQALQAWLTTLEMKSTHTQRAYARDVERLLLWASEQGKTLSTLTVADAVAHARFLTNPPPHWVNPLPTERSRPDWRPMRGPLTRSSANRALASIGHLYGFLVESGYLVANPFAHVRSLGRSSTLHERMDTRRSFNAQHLRAIDEYLASLPDDPAKRRLVALLMLAEYTGMRRFELAGHTWGDLRPAQAGGAEGLMTLSVRGKGGQERLVPIKPSVLAALQRHRADRDALVSQGLLAAVPDELVPLISVIDPATRMGHGNPAGGLSSSRMNDVLKGFFKAVGKGCGDEQLQEDFERASCHWLRHTFAHGVLKASGNDLPVTQQLLGHKSISTTGIYLKADMGQRIEAVMAMPERFDER